MKINKNSTSFKLWALGYDLENPNSYLPETTNLCDYMKTIMTVPIISTLFIFLNFLGLLFGYRPFSFNPLNKDFYDHEKYDGLKIGKYMLYPWQGILAALFVFFNYVLACLPGVSKIVMLSAFNGAVLLFVLFIWVMRTSHEPSLLSSWLQSKKDKVCPVITFEK